METQSPILTGPVYLLLDLGLLAAIEVYKIKKYRNETKVLIKKDK